MKQHGVDEERFPARELQWFISGAKEEGLRPARGGAHRGRSAQGRDLPALRGAVPARGGGRFRRAVLRSYELLRDNDPIREHYRRRFRHILIDEFQDTNRLQYAWIKMSRGPATRCSPSATTTRASTLSAARGRQHGGLRAGVRGAPPGQAGADYRSFSNILDSANALIAHNRTAPVQEPAHDQGRASRCACTRRHGHGGGAVAGGGDPAAGARRRAAPRDRGALSQQRAEPGARDGAVQRRVPYRVYGGCASSSAPRSSTRWRTCGCWRIRTTTPASCGW